MTSPPRYDGLADWYDRQIGGLGVTATALQVLGRLVGSGPGSCLDLGCGTGIAIPGLLKRGWRVVGVDLSSDQLRVARQRAGPPAAVLVVADASVLPFGDSSFDAVVSVLTHTDLDDPKALSPKRPGCCAGRTVQLRRYPSLLCHPVRGAAPISSIRAIASVAGIMPALGSAKGSGPGWASIICPWPT
jgi:SAM-dependent methyltransferase